MVAFYNDNRSEFDRNLHFTYVYNMLLYKKLFVLSEKLIKKQLAMTETIRSDLKVFINPQIIGQHCQSWQEFLRYVNHGINENETINFRKFIADNCKGSEIVKMLEEIKGKITQGQLTEEDRSNFRYLIIRDFTSFLASNNSERAHSLLLFNN